MIDAVDELKITYEVNKQLQNIITEKNLVDYNEGKFKSHRLPATIKKLFLSYLVFRFLLKVKWGLWTLENLQFQRKYKTRPPYAALKMIDFLMRRLEQLRFWMLYAMQCLHFYLTSHVLQSMGMKLDEKIMNCTTLSEMRTVHDSFIETVCSHCFLKPSKNNIKFGIGQVRNFVDIYK